jgi:hypothetical protein
MDAAVGPIKVPDNVIDEQALFLSDIIPSASGRYRSRVDRRKQTIEPERSKLTVVARGRRHYQCSSFVAYVDDRHFDENLVATGGGAFLSIRSDKTRIDAPMNKGLTIKTGQTHANVHEAASGEDRSGRY